MGFIELIKSLVGKKGWDYSERRGKARVKCRIEASLLRGQGLIGIEVRNISIKGMQVLCFGKVKKGDKVELKGVKQYNQAEIHSLNCQVEWVKKDSAGWLAGVSFLDSPQEMSKSWLYWELKDQGLRMMGADQKRKNHRVKCLLPSRLTSRTQNLNARVVNLGLGGAMVQTMGEQMSEGETVTLRFGPLEDLPKIAARAQIASVHVEGAPVYGLQFLSFETGGPNEIKRYLDFFFRK